MRNHSPEWLICLRSQSQKIAELGLQPRTVLSSTRCRLPALAQKIIYWISTTDHSGRIWKQARKSHCPQRRVRKSHSYNSTQCDKEDAQAGQKHSGQRTHLWTGKEVSAGRHKSEKARERVFWALNDLANIFYFPIEYVQLFFKILKPRGPQEQKLHLSLLLLHALW